MAKLKYAGFCYDINQDSNPLFIQTDEGSFVFQMTNAQRQEFFPSLKCLDLEDVKKIHAAA